MMDLDLGLEYRRVAEAHGLDIETLGRMAIDGIASTWLDEVDRASLRAAFETALAEILTSASSASSPSPDRG
jgi:hypothetical protein